ncbi:hypothetical protein T4B_6349 [Trichinella pseudospiralis]|uniref:BOD1/SHG1 domain-containing protein n=2 Tax=Trichinella pseudospiralis TaxID=6337 RepID=A0A0V1JXL1_TRIPS|nr:hypothetical protein T4A_8216 [Trichinella pseudospiralis]KRY88059.1 hypothetical protein T4D_4094 [Trichinella pseudospiralis]KRZ33128.1 hypothetical protein T4B_6349 [Trichinella pseudospiralis]KRZ39638.1 hypothetical protein T4C_9979 [Trichinella pseudospiralis]
MVTSFGTATVVPESQNRVYLQCLVCSQEIMAESTYSKIREDVSKTKRCGHYDTLRQECLATIMNDIPFKTIENRLRNLCEKILRDISWNPTSNKTAVRDEMEVRLKREDGFTPSVNALVRKFIATPYFQEKAKNIIREVVMSSKDTKESDSAIGTASSTTSVNNVMSTTVSAPMAIPTNYNMLMNSAPATAAYPFMGATPGSVNYNQFLGAAAAPNAAYASFMGPSAEVPQFGLYPNAPYVRQNIPQVVPMQPYYQHLSAGTHLQNFGPFFTPVPQAVSFANPADATKQAITNVTTNNTTTTVSTQQPITNAMPNVPAVPGAAYASMFTGIRPPGSEFFNFNPSIAFGWNPMNAGVVQSMPTGVPPVNPALPIVGPQRAMTPTTTAHSDVKFRINLTTSQAQ